MGQYWKFFNLDSSVEVRTSVGGKFGEFFPHELGCDADILCALWVSNEEARRVTIKSCNDEGLRFPQQSEISLSQGPLGQLSTEIFGLILDEVQNLPDLTSMMMTCQRMWEIGRQHLESLIESLLIYGSWAGHRLVCLGDYADLDDLPKDMMTPSEVKYIRDFLGEDEDDSYGCSMFDGIRALQQYNLQVSFTFLDPQSLLSVMKIKSGSQLWYELDWPMERSFLRSRNYKRLYLYLAFETLVQITSPPSPKSFYSGDIVLRNLTTKEYVRGDGITELWDTPEKPWLEEIRFEHALYMRTTWSSDGSLSLNYDGPIQIHRGIWAGNRFDVSGIKTVRDENGSSVDGWKDVTDDVLKEVVEVWENEGRWRY